MGLADVTLFEADNYHGRQLRQKEETGNLSIREDDTKLYQLLSAWENNGVVTMSYAEALPSEVKTTTISVVHSNRLKNVKSTYMKSSIALLLKKPAKPIVCKETQAACCTKLRVIG
ncbi:unnamed protein product [Angiostrongylus costaricensis]|uniref:Transposase n=1 Tax=Angiostrongylus costaricensis TaxID=334426 RepID=A0A0R3Q0E4_ANGCS|nr:unnamed protein product [Angiostrongylus costaricensis]